MLTQGVTHGLDMVIRALLRPGNTVPTSPNSRPTPTSADAAAGPELQVVPQCRTPGRPGLRAGAGRVAQHRPRAIRQHRPAEPVQRQHQHDHNAFRILQLTRRHMFNLLGGSSAELAQLGVTPMPWPRRRRQVVYLGRSRLSAVVVGLRSGAPRPDARHRAQDGGGAGVAPEIMERIVHQVIREAATGLHRACPRTAG